MIHVYRDATARSVGFWGLFVPVFLFFVGFLVLALLPIVGGEGDGFGWDDLMVLGVFGAPLVLVLVYLAFKRQGYEECREIRLDDGGTCELETASGRVIRIHVNEITSVRYSRDSDSDSESYTIRYQCRELHVTERMTDFLDFLTRLKALNPAVEMSTFPRGSRPGQGGPTEQPGHLRRIVQSAFFPAIVIVLLVYWSSQALLDY